MRVNINGHSGLVRDISSGAILNTNRTDYENYIAKQLEQQKQQAMLTTQTEELNTLRDEVNDLKRLIQTLIKEQNG